MYSKYISLTEATAFFSTMRAKLLTSVIAGAVVLLFVTISTSAQNGEDTKFYPASMCRPQGPQNNPNFTVTPQGTIYNASKTSSLKVDCPVVRDISGWKSIPGTEGSAYVWGRIVLDDKHPTQNVVCQFRQDDIHFQPKGGVNTVQSQGTNALAQPQTLLMPVVALIPNPPTSYHINCTIPPAITKSDGTLSTSGIHLYEIREGGTYIYE